MQNIIEILRVRNFLVMLLISAAAASFGCSTQHSAATRDAGSGDAKVLRTSGSDQTPETNKNTQTPAMPAERRAETDDRRNRNDIDIEEAPVSEDDGKVVSKANFDKITNGMSYQQVVKALGGDKGMLVSTMNLNGRETQTYKWSNADYSKYIDVIFEKEKVVEKKQKGLS
jgi:hypothetical protein